jgi:hypothetical protein
MLHFSVDVNLEWHARVFFAQHLQQAAGAFGSAFQHLIELGEKLRTLQGAALQLMYRVSETFHGVIV